MMTYVRDMLILMLDWYVGTNYDFKVSTGKTGKYLKKYLPKDIEIKTHEDYGISNNYKEVMAFALLGYCTFYKIPNNVPECTGASKKVVLGQISYC